MSNLDFTEIEESYEPSEEDERHFWNGEGFIKFYVEQNIPEDNIFEIEVEDSGGWWST